MDVDGHSNQERWHMQLKNSPKDFKIKLLEFIYNLLLSKNNINILWQKMW